MPEKYQACVDCGQPKTTYSQQLSPRCGLCSGQRKRQVGRTYYTHCLDCGKPTPSEHRRYPRCRECAWKYMRKHEFFDVCQECGKPKKHTKSRLCLACGMAARKEKARAEAETRTHDVCEDCGQPKSATTSPVCHKCSTLRGWDGRRKHAIYDTCQSCGKPKTKNDRELCLSCAGVKRMTELFGNDDREYPIGWSHTFKKKIRERDHNRCVLCGKTERENGRKMDVHHIDEDKHNLDEKNLISLCCVCHGKVKWNRKFWRQALPYHFRQLKQDWQMRAVVL